MTARYLPVLLSFTLLAVFFALSSAEVINFYFTGVDLARHLKNGELLLSADLPAGDGQKILNTNYYSYAEPESAFVNHHWLADILFYPLSKNLGIEGLNACYILLGILTLALFWSIAQASAGWAIATAVALPLVPILRVRPAVRPEIFTLLFCGVFLWLLWNHSTGKVGWRALLALPVIEALWVNLHIGFILGPVFIGAFLLGELIESRRFDRRWFGLLALTLLAALLNPSGVRGALYPLTVWSNYGLDVRENQSILFVESHGFTGEFLLIKLTLAAMYLSFVPAAFRGRTLSYPMFFLAVLTGVMAWFTFRNQTLLAFFALSAIGVNLASSGVREYLSPWKTRPALLLALLIAAGVSYNVWKLRTRIVPLGLGLVPGNSGAADFLRANHIEGPILNNFNIGGYLIYYLFPQYRVYVDSRPEAYSSDFIHDKYVAPLQDENLWSLLVYQYRFNVIFFSTGSPWENDFCARRIQDPQWAPVYAQAPVLILLRRTPGNQSVIARQEIPRDRLFAK